MKNLFLLLLHLLPSVLLGQQVIYVNPGSQGQNNGTSWANAFISLHDGLNASNAGDELWIAQGVYFTTLDSDQTIRFELKSGVRMYGGFSGNETEITQRNWEMFPTIIDGDIGVLGDSVDNTFNLLYLADPDAATTVDGIVFQNGIANNPNLFELGLGTCGGAIFIDAKTQSAFPLIANCVFKHNASRMAGGAVYATSSQGNRPVAPRFWNCRFEYNKCYGGWGGALYRRGACNIEFSGDFLNCRFLYNESFAEGGAVFLSEGQRIDTINIINCRFVGNFSKSLGGGIFTSGRSTGIMLEVRGSEFMGNKARIGVGFCHYSENFPVKYISFDSCNFISNEFYLSDQAPVFYSGSLSIYSGYYNATDSMERNVVIENCKIINQERSVLDIVLFHGNITIKNNLFDGSDIKLTEFLTSFGKISIISNKIINCNGSLYISNTAAPPSVYIINNVFANVRSTFKPILSFSPGSYIIGNLFLENKTEGFGSFILSSSPPHIIKNNIFWGNLTLPQPSGYNPGIPFYFDSAYFSYNLVDFANCDNMPSQFLCLGNNIFGLDPQFVDQASGDYQLLPCSPAINAGDNEVFESNNIVSDIQGSARIKDGTADVGPYESAGLSPVVPPQIQPSCPGNANGSVQFFIENGCSPFEFQWTGPNGTLGNDTTGLAQGVYIFDLNDNNGKTWHEMLEVPVSEAPQITGNIQDASCPNCTNGSIQLTLSGGFPPFIVHWSNDSISTTLNQLLPGNYYLSITDASGCLYEFNYTVGVIVGTEEKERNKIVSVFPNPASDWTVISVNPNSSGIIALLDLTGKIWRRVLFSTTDGTVRLNLSNIPAGMYECLLHNENGEREIVKIMIDKL